MPLPMSLPMSLPVPVALLGALVAGVALALAPSAPAFADGRYRMPAEVPSVYAQECGACHLAYPPALLPASAWSRLMSGLGDHFGSDASVDVSDRRVIEAWLQANAAAPRRMRTDPPAGRISRTDWFARKHRRVAAATWELASVRSAGNCAACHPGAARGDFDDDDLIVPAGLSAARSGGRRP